MVDEQTPRTQREIEPGRKAWVETISLLFRHKTLIIVTTLLVTVLTGIYLFFFAPMWYKAEANVFPARKPGGLLDNLTSGISSTIKDLGLTPLAGKVKNDGTYSPMALASSRTILQTLLNEFHLKEEYHSKTNEDALKEIKEHESVDVLEEGNVSISFEDQDPKRAAEIANRLVALLNDVNSNLAIEEAKFNRTYTEQRYNNLLNDLDAADSALGAYQRKFGVYELKSQAQAQLTVLGALEQQQFLSETQLANAQQLYGDQSPEANTVRVQLSEVQNKLEDLKTGMDSAAKSYFVPTDLMPDVALDYLRLTRQVEILSKLKAFMLPSFEQAKMDESKHTLLYLVLDSAIAPMHKSRPKRAVSLLIALFGSFALTSISVIAWARISDAREGFRRDRATLGV